MICFPPPSRLWVRPLQTMVLDGEQTKIAAMPEVDRINLDLGLGLWIRNNSGFYECSTQLLRDSGNLATNRACPDQLEARRQSDG